ncbi:hypothetical protein [Rubneribacter sp.]
MRALIACEESQAVTLELRKLGHEAYSCDVLPCSGGHPEWHVQADALEVAKMSWDMVLAFPPCTHLAVSGARWFPEKVRDGRQQRAIGFFLAFTALDHVPRVAIKNPVGIMSRLYRKLDQIIQPWMFGHAETKATCLWLKGLPKLEPTDLLKGVELAHRVHEMPPGPERALLRSKTYAGVARAIAVQWAGPA